MSTITGSSTRSSRATGATPDASVAPLAAAADAYVLDTTDLDADGVFRAAVAVVEAAGRRERPAGGAPVSPGGVFG